jgi:hypothetical protein
MFVNQKLCSLKFSGFAASLPEMPVCFFSAKWSYEVYVDVTLYAIGMPVASPALHLLFYQYITDPQGRRLA